MYDENKCHDFTIRFQNLRDGEKNINPFSGINITKGKAAYKKWHRICSVADKEREQKPSDNVLFLGCLVTYESW